MTNTEEKELVARGAECVAGDLILNRVLVGQYRNGQFILTPEGRHELDTVVVAAEAAPAKAAPRASTSRGKKAAQAEPADDAGAATEPDTNPAPEPDQV